MSEAITLNAYRRRLAAHNAGLMVMKPIAFMAFGDGGHNADMTAKAPDEEATALFHEVLRKPLAAVTQEDFYSVTGKGLVDGDELIGVAVSEAALVDADGNLCGIKTFAPKHKEDGEQYGINLTLRY